MRARLNRSLTIDSVVIIALMFGAAYLFETWPSAPENARKWAFFLIWAGYEPIATVFGCTVGNYPTLARMQLQFAVVVGSDL